MKSIMGKLHLSQLSQFDALPLKIKTSFSYKSTHRSFLSLEKLIHARFHSIYSNDKNFYNIKIINEIICNESTHIVAAFKDYLIDGDYSEFLQKSYSLNECLESLPKIYDYYDSCSVIFPNYVILPESKYLYKNIQRKQRVIDNQQEIEAEKEKRTKGIVVKTREDKVFNTTVFDSLIKMTDTSTLRGFMGMSEKEDCNEDNSIDKVIEEIDRCEVKRVIKEMKEVKGRNYKRGCDYGENTTREEVIFSSRDLNSKIKTTTTTKKKARYTYSSYGYKYNDHKRSLINTLLNSNNKEILIKAFKEINKNKVKHNNKGKVMKTVSPRFPNSKNSKLSSSSSSSNNNVITTHSKNTVSMPRLSQIPLTAREPQTFNVNPEIMSMLNAKIKKMKNFTKSKTSMSVSHKKTFTSSSAATATGSYNTKNIDEKKSTPYISVSKRDNSKGNNTKIAVRSSLTITKNDTSSHRHTKSTVISNVGGIKGITIKGFDEIIGKSSFNSRNAKNGSVSDRLSVNVNSNSRKNISIGRTMSSIGYTDIFKTIKKK